MTLAESPIGRHRDVAGAFADRVEAVDRFYTADVFMHTWDLARATGQEPDLDEAYAATLLDGMRPIEELLRSSGQYGAPVAVAADAPVVDRLTGFIGRDPDWPGGAGSGEL